MRPVRARARARTHIVGNCRAEVSYGEHVDREAVVSCVRRHLHDIAARLRENERERPERPRPERAEGRKTQKGPSVAPIKRRRRWVCAGVRGPCGGRAGVRNARCGGRAGMRNARKQGTRRGRAEARLAARSSKKCHQVQSASSALVFHLGQRLHGGTSGLGGGVPITEDGMQLHEIAPFGILQGNPGGEHSRCGPLGAKSINHPDVQLSLIHI